jgi:AraC family transcriptional regulator
MGYLEDVLKAAECVEENLMKPFTLRDVASRVRYSPYHFHRLFHAVAGETLGAYARKQRLAEAAHELAETRRRVSDIALDYQFQSQEGFTRAFVRMFGVTPTRYRKRPTAMALTPANGSPERSSCI